MHLLIASLAAYGGSDDILSGGFLAYEGLEFKHLNRNGALTLGGNVQAADETDRDDHLFWRHVSPILPFANDQRDADSANEIVMCAYFGIKAHMPRGSHMILEALDFLF